MPGMNVDPMLKGVDRGDPGKYFDNPLKMLAPRAICFGRRIEFLQELVSQQFHAHRCHFAKLDGCAAIGINILATRGERMKSVASFMEHRINVPLQAHSVHEDKRQPRFVQGRLIATRRFPFAVIEVQQPIIAHGLKSGGKSSIESIKNILSAIDHLVSRFKWAKRWTVKWIDGEVPGTQ